MPRQTAAQRQKSALQSIALDMRRMLTDTDAAWVHRRLSHGLEIVLQRKSNGRWRLALGRESVQPSDQELAVCRPLFGVPVDAEERRFSTSKIQAKTNRLTLYHIAEMEWVELEETVQQPVAA